MLRTSVFEIIQFADFDTLRAQLRTETRAKQKKPGLFV